MRPSLTDIYTPISGPLQETRVLVSGLWAGTLRLVSDSPGATMDAGGKLLRPALCLLSAGATGCGDMTPLIPMAAASEVFHVAALVHDDVVDGAKIRRGMASLNALADDHAAVLAGDLLMARGLAIIAEYAHSGVISKAIACIETMSRGELEALFLGGKPHDEAACLALARAKTGALFGMACSLPALLAGLPIADNLDAYGQLLGEAFQIADDLLDLTQTAGALGKPVCGDILGGKTTLPIMFMRERSAPDELDRLTAMRGRDAISPDDAAWIHAHIERTGALEAARVTAQRAAGEARDRLAGLPPTSYRDSMEALTYFVVERTA